jgi:hypothetical protein
MNYAGGRQGEAKRLRPAQSELEYYLERVPKNHKLVVIYGKQGLQSMWPAYAAEDASELKMIRRACFKQGWTCAYYAIPADWIINEPRS